MRLHTLFVSHNREEMTVKNVGRYKKACEHALKHVETLDETTCTIWVTTKHEQEYFNNQFKQDNQINVSVVKNYIERAPLLMSKHLKTTEADLFHITWDDHGVYEDCYTLAINAMLERFPKTNIHAPAIEFSYNGIIGIDIANYPQHWPWQGWCGSQHLIGAGYIRGWESVHGNKPLFCPDYKRVLWECEFAACIRFHNRIWYCRAARLDHWRPDTNTNKSMWNPDKSHIEGRVDGSMQRDALMHAERRKLGYYWGLNFDLVGKV